MATQYLTATQGKIAYDDNGTGPLVICVPGMGDLRQEYRFLAPKLVDAGFRVVTMDVRGHGESSTGWSDYSVAGVGDDIIALAKELNSGPATIIGNSMAAGAAICAAAKAPTQISNLVLISPFVRDMGSLLMGRIMMSVLFARPWGVWMWSQYFPSLFPTHKPADFPEYLQKLLTNLKEPGRFAALKQMLLASKQASGQVLDQVNKPTLVIVGTKDRDYKDPAVEANFVAGKLHGKVEMIEGAGHYPHSEMPELTIPLIVKFLQDSKQTATMQKRVTVPNPVN